MTHFSRKNTNISNFKAVGIADLHEVRMLLRTYLVVDITSWAVWARWTVARLRYKNLGRDEETPLLVRGIVSEIA